ncbi:MAG: GAF domain-containing protein [Cyanobacteria bacterium P01_G01_bin.19]
MTQSINSKTNTYQHLEEIFQLTIEMTRKKLKCDRVIVYDASELPKSEVIAESVAPGHTSIKGTIVTDPFLAEEYLEMYCYGRTVGINDISTTDLGEDKLEDLTELGVKSLAIAPISVDNKLLAFLVVHQCSEARDWSSEAINFLTEKANATGFALSNIVRAQKPESVAEGSSCAQNDTPNLSVSEEPISQAEVQNQASETNLTMDRGENGNGNGNYSNGNGISDSNIEPSQQQTKIQGDEVRSFSDALGKIASEIGQENILNAAVEELRHLLHCDRVVVYGLNQDDYGVIIAESLAAGWTRALGKTIDDPCFAARYIEKYSKGRVRAWDDVSAEDTASCYLEQLKALEVKAKVVAPIIRENELFGLLIVHQCDYPRHWREQEINWITEIATQVGLMLEYTETFTETESESAESLKLLAAENQWNQHLTDAIQYIRTSIEKEDILKASVKEVRRVLECDRVVVYSMNSEDRGTIVAESVAPGWTKAKGKVIDDPCFEAKYLDKYRDGRVRAWSNIYESGLTKCYIEQLEELEVKANLVTPILNEGRLFGLLVAHQCSDFRPWQQPEVQWVTQIATQVGFALDNAQSLANARQLEQQLENETKLTKYFTDAVRYIRESLQEEDILEISVEEVRRVLNCDRVVVYSMNSDNHGMIVAESVAPGWTRAQGKVIKDPCFEAKYLEKYRNGRVRAWSNIYEAGMTRCYIEQLEELEVKANLVTPIVNEGKLFGLLVAHQCSDFRAWQQPEIRWVTQIATQVAFALDNAKLLVEARHLKQQVRDESKWTEYFTDAIQHIRESLKTQDILKTSVKEVRRTLECDRVVVYSMNSDNRGEIVAESVTPGWTRAKGTVINDPCFESRYLEKYRNGRVRAWNNIYEAGMTRCYIEQLEKLEVKANLVTPIINEGNLFGLLVAHQCSNTRQWQQAEIRWVAQIATQVGFALDNAKLLEQLQESNQTNSQVSNQQYEQTEILKDRVVEILTDKVDAYQTLSQEAMRQSETTINVLHQIQKVADSFNDIALNVKQVKFQEQQNDLAIQDTQDSLQRAVGDISQIQRTVQNAAVGFDNIGDSTRSLAEAVNTIRDVSKQIVQQSMNLARAVNRSQIDANSQDSMMDLSDNIFSSMQQLYEASAKIEPLFASIQTEIREKTIALDAGTHQLIGGTGEFQSVRQKLERVVTLNNKMNTLIESIAQSVENQTQSSTFAKDSVQEVASIAERISAQSMTITQSFNQLVVLVQKL